MSSSSQALSPSSTEATETPVTTATTTASPTIPTTTPITNTTASSSCTSPLSTWTLPNGIEDDIEQALIKTAVGVVAGGLFGVVFMRSGNGRRAASMATGMGAAMGSTYERVKTRYEQQQLQERFNIQFEHDMKIAQQQKQKKVEK